MKGIVLAGGKSVRYGSDKALAVHDGRRFVERAVRLLESAGLEPAVVTSPGKTYDFLSCEIIYDTLPGMGPLGGLYTAMTVFPDHLFAALTCDMPLLDAGVLTALSAKRAPPDEITHFTLTGTPEPFPCILSRAIFPRVREHLSGGRLSMRYLFERSRTAAHAWTGDGTVFANVNHPGSLIS